MPRIRIHTPDGERIVGTPNCSTLTVQLTAHAQQPTLRLRAEAELVSGTRVLQRWAWDFPAVDHRTTVALISEPGSSFDPADAIHEPDPPGPAMTSAVTPAVTPAAGFSGDPGHDPGRDLNRGFALLAAAMQDVGAAAPPSMQVSRPGAEPTHHCAFCGKGREAVRRLIAGPAAAICGDCINAAHSLANPPANLT